MKVWMIIVELVELRFIRAGFPTASQRPRKSSGDLSIVVVIPLVYQKMTVSDDNHTIDISIVTGPDASVELRKNGSIYALGFRGGRSPVLTGPWSILRGRMCGYK